MLLLLPVAGAVLMGVVKVVRAAGTVLWWVSHAARQIALGLLRGDWGVVAAVIFAAGLGAMLWTNAMGPEPSEALSVARPMLDQAVAGPITVAHLIAGGVGGGMAHAIHRGTRAIVCAISGSS